jgi:hypothetical protein
LVFGLGFMGKNCFGEEVAARYDATIGEWGEPEVVDPAVEFLAELARLRAKPRGAEIPVAIGDSLPASMATSRSRMSSSARS